MKTFKEWYKDVAGIEPDYKATENRLLWCKERGLPLIVSCTCCEGTIFIFDCRIDDKDYIFCPSCAGE